MLKIQIILTIILLRLSGTLAQVCSIPEENTDYIGVPNPIDLSMRYASSYLDCCNQCSSVTLRDCFAWTYTEGVCYFKSAVGLKIYSFQSEY